MKREIAELMEKYVPQIDKNDTLYHAFKIMEKHDLDKIIVTENRVIAPGKEINTIAGILTSRDIVDKLGTQRMRRTTPGKLHVSSFMSIPPITITPETTLYEAAKIMDEKNIGILPVIADNEIIGGILRDHIVRLASDDDTEVRHIMDTSPLIAKTTDRILKIRQDMLSNDISFMPVVDEYGELIGYITIYELAFSFFRFEDIVPAKYRKERIMHLIVEDIMRFRPPKLRIMDTVSKAITEIYKKNSRGAVVVDEIGRPVGVVTTHIVLKHILTNRKDLLLGESSNR